MNRSQFESLESRQLMAVSLGTNLVLNGNAEYGPSAPGWNTASGFTVAHYGTPGLPDLASPGPADRGTSFFSGGKQTTPGVPPQAEQRIDISELAADIDAGRIVSNLSAWLGGYKMEGDDMYIRRAFNDATGKEISFTGRIGPSPAERGGQTAFALRSIVEDVPVGTRAITINLLATKKVGAVHDGYADNISLLLSSKAGNAKGFISGNVYNDANGDKKEGAAEKGLAGVTVFVDRNKNAKLDKGEFKATSGADGKYLISGVPAGTVHLRQIVPGTFRATDAVARKVTVRGGLTTTGQKFGDSQTVVIAGNVFSDTNANGKRNAGEGGLAGVKVFLDANNNGEHDDTEQSATSDANGNFSFVTRHGTYTVRQEAQPGTRQTAPAKNKPLVITLAKGKTSFGNLFGVTRI